MQQPDSQPIRLDVGIELWAEMRRSRRVYYRLNYKKIPSIILFLVVIPYGFYWVGKKGEKVTNEMMKISRDHI
jgi:hypothetical protein